MRESNLVAILEQGIKKGFSDRVKFKLLNESQEGASLSNAEGQEVPGRWKS